MLKLSFKSIFHLVVIILFTGIAYAQNLNNQIKISVFDNNDLHIYNVKILLNDKDFINADENGIIKLDLPTGNYSIKFLHPDYEEKSLNIFINKDLSINENLNVKGILLYEVFLSAREDKGLTSKSIIDKKAMEHLQPSSFSDLMELLPGGLAKAPNLTGTNVALLRENVGRPSTGSKYDTSSLGIQFMVDDNIINSNSDLQTSLNQSALLYAPSYRNTVTTGVDMRSISTNDIEKVEVIRGIPSAEYGDLTSGLIKIERKIGETPIQARIKVDGYSKQYYLGKGFRLKDNWNLNTSVDFLDAKNDPSDNQQNYQRIGASIRSEIKLNLNENPLRWRANLDFSSTLDNVSLDLDNAYLATDSYKSYTRKFTLANNFIYELPKSFFSFITLNTSIRQGIDRIEQKQFVQYSGPRALPLSTVEGESVGIFAKTSFVAEYMTDGKPSDINAQLKAKGEKTFLGFTNVYEAGLDWRLSKNNGRGEVYDVTQPPSSSMSTRPRSFRDIPGNQNIAAFIGDRIDYKINKHSFALYAGLRLSKLLGIDKSYKISDKFFTEPRFNFQYGLPQFLIAGKPLQIDVTLGYGKFYKQPTTYYLYPNRQFTDYVQLNYYHNNENYRYINYYTYIQSLENKNIAAAKNIKKEIRIDFSYKKHNFFITYYKENMSNGFRPFNNYRVNTYKKYDTSKIDLSSWTANGPDLTNIPYTTIKEHAAYTTTENGSVTDKEGIEFQYSTPRFKGINTRFTLSGAWFKTKYHNDILVYEKPSISVGGVVGSFPYVGIYENDDSYTNSNLNYNLMMDTYIPSLDLIFSASVQGYLFTHNIREKIIAFSTAYIDLDGVEHQFTEADKNDIYKQHLERSKARSEPLSERKSYTINVNFKVTKSIYKALRASMFVNQIYSYTNPYYFNNVKVEMINKTTPYFGVEMNYNF